MNTIPISVTSVELLQSKLQEFKTQGFHPTVAISFCDPNFDIKGVIDVFNSLDIQLVGCTTAGEIYDNQISFGTFTALLLDIPKEHFKIDYQHGEGNDYTLIYEIDNKPALDLFNQYFPSIDYRQQEGQDELFTIPGIYPLKIFRDNGVEFLRSGKIYDFENKALILAGAVKEGDVFKFCPTPNFDVVEITIDKFKQMAESTRKDVDAIIINSCAGRHFAFGPMFEDEIEGLYNIWNKPTIGYMAYGEIGTTGDDAVSEFHNVSCSLLTLR